MSKDEVLYFLKRNKFIIAAVAVVVVIITIIIISVLRAKWAARQIQGSDMLVADGSAVALDGTTYDAYYIQTNFELRQLIVEGSWEKGTQYRVYFDRINNTYSVWQVNSSITGRSNLQQVDKQFSIIGQPKELKEIPSLNSGAPDLQVLDENFYHYDDISQALEFINTKITSGYILTYTKLQTNMCEAYLVYLGQAYHVLAADNLLMIAPYNGEYAQTMVEQATQQEKAEAEAENATNTTQEENTTSTEDTNIEQEGTTSVTVEFPNPEEAEPTDEESIDTTTDDTSLVEIEKTEANKK